MRERAPRRLELQAKLLFDGCEDAWCGARRVAGAPGATKPLHVKLEIVESRKAGLVDDGPADSRFEDAHEPGQRDTLSGHEELAVNRHGQRASKIGCHHREPLRVAPSAGTRGSCCVARASRGDGFLELRFALRYAQHVDVHTPRFQMEVQVEPLAQEIPEHACELLVCRTLWDVGDNVVAFCAEPVWPDNLVRTNAKGLCNQWPEPRCAVGDATHLDAAGGREDRNPVDVRGDLGASNRGDFESVRRLGVQREPGRRDKHDGGVPTQGGDELFQAHIELLQFFLGRRGDIVERIQDLLNAQRKPAEYLQNHAVLSRHFEDGFFIGVTQSQSRLRGRLEEAHSASGFRPRDIPGLHNGLIDPAEMIIRAFHLWERTRWPGRNGRVRYAHTLFNLYVIRCLALLSMRVWDDGAKGAADRLSQVQGVLDGLWRIRVADHPVLVRDARWLVPMAQSPATDELGAYFDVAEKVATSLSEDDRIEIHKAGVRMVGGHLRSQIRYYALKKRVPLDDISLVLITRGSNALDFALLIQELVPLLEAYEQAWRGDDRQRRLELADAICQGISPDPELFLNRVELLGAYSTIEHLFVATDPEGRAAYTPMGRRHMQLLEEYEARIGRVSKGLAEDCAHFRPAVGTYSPYGVLFGFSSDLIGHMALKTVDPAAVTRFGLEDVFVAGDAEKLAWVSGWRKLPHLAPEVARQFDYPQQFAEEIFGRIEEALPRRVSGGEASADVQTGRIFIVSDDELRSHSKAVVKAESYDEVQLLSDRREGRALLSYRTASGWVAIRKDVLTEVLGAGRDADVVGLPHAAADALKLMCRSLIVLPASSST